jgi:hypothetical protein
VTSETEDEGRLIELLLNSAKTGGETSPLAVIEPILTVARITQQPADWTFTARIWTEGLASINRSWSKIAEAIHGYGRPTITLNSLRDRVPGGLEGYWHGYIKATSQHWRTLSRWHSHGRSSAFSVLPTLPTVCRRRNAAGTTDPSRIRPSSRRRGSPSGTCAVKASIAVMQHRKGEAPDRYPWTQVGISERRH